jgi:hypothetical protein
MHIELRYFDDCPNWQAVRTSINDVAGELGLEATVTTRLVETQDQAIALEFQGSPTIVVNGVDPFAEPEAPIGLACRIYRTETGMAGAPSADQLRAVLAGAAG